MLPEQTSPRQYASVPEDGNFAAMLRKGIPLVIAAAVLATVIALAPAPAKQWPLYLLAGLLVAYAVYGLFLHQSQNEALQALRMRERELDTSNTKLAHVALAIQEAIWDWNVHDNATQWSDGLQTLLGYRASEIRSFEWWLENIHPDDRDRVSVGVQEALAGANHYWTSEYRFKRAAGSYADIHDRASIVRSSGGKAIRMIGAMADLTQRNLSARALAERERQLRLFFDSALDAMVIQDDMGRYLDVNPAACKLFDLTREQLIGRSGRDFMEPGCDQKALWRQFMKDGRYRGDLTLVRLDGMHRIVEVSATANYLPSRHFSILRDITEQRGLELQLRQSHKMEALGRFAGGIAHDFNNQLNVIIGYSELIENKLEPESLLRRYVGKVVESADHAAQLTDRLLSFSSNKPVLVRTMLDLNEVVSDVGERLPALLSDGITYKVQCTEGLGLIRADRGQIEQVIANLVINARDAMGESGTLTLETERIRLDEAQCKEDINVIPGEYATLAVGDTGCGMDASTLAHLFEPFFTTKDVGKGAGLGLATVYGIVRQSGGFIRVQSTVGSGTSFRVYLPLAPEPTRLSRRREQMPRTGLGTILLAEDESALREATSEYLQSQGYTVLQAANGAEALDLARRHHDTINLLLTDVIMPVLDGKELGRRIGSVVPGIKILFVSGYTDGTIMQDDLLDMSAAFMQKPYAFRALVQKIREMLEQKTAERPAYTRN